jgi:threonine dehydrogenase-like Zn-dependent dehydrogenase
MRALMYERPGELHHREVPTPGLPSPVGALVHPIAVAACDLDRVIAHGLPGFEPPFPLGHEVAGEIIEIGPDVRERRVGEVVAVSFQPACGHCRPCDRGVSAACRAVPPTSTYGLGPLGGGWGGAFADVLAVPYADFMLAPLPAGVSVRQAANASDNASDAYRCVQPALSVDPGAPVLVAGDGAIPLLAADCAVRLGAERVSLYARRPDMLTLAESRGIDVFAVGDAWPARMPTHPITVDCTSDAAGLRGVIASTEPGGTCTVAGMHLADVTLPMAKMYLKGITVRTGRAHGASDLPAVLDAIAAGTLDPLAVDPLVTTFDDLPEAIMGDALKVIGER